MRRKDREISDIGEIFNILNRCHVLHLAINDEPYPYVVPLSFGAELENGQIIAYFHGAQAGHKVDLLGNSKSVCMEAETFFRTEQVKDNFTTRYESVIGTGICEKLVRREDILKGLQSIMVHAGFGEFPVENCSSLPAVNVYRIVLVCSASVILTSQAI